MASIIIADIAARFMLLFMGISMVGYSFLYALRYRKFSKMALAFLIYTAGLMLIFFAMGVLFH